MILSNTLEQEAICVIFHGVVEDEVDISGDFANVCQGCI